MSSFKDTSIWKKKDASTLVYSYEVDGKQHDGSSEKEPNSLLVQLERMSALDETSWRNVSTTLRQWFLDFRLGFLRLVLVG
jgi:hypothetical protein